LRQSFRVKLAIFFAQRRNEARKISQISSRLCFLPPLREISHSFFIYLACLLNSNNSRAMKKTMPFDFLLDYLPAGVIVKPAVGMFYIYFDKKIVLIFRKTAKNPQHNGIWISCRREDHASLKAGIPAITNFVFDDDFDTAWLLLNNDHDDFESAAIQLCQLVSDKDKRVGKVTPTSAALFEH